MKNILLTFYQSVVYPIIREELYKNYEDEEIQKYIEQSTSGCL